MKIVFTGFFILLSSQLLAEDLSQKLWNELNIAIGKTPKEDMALIEEDFISTSLAAPQREKPSEEKPKKVIQEMPEWENSLKKTKPWKTRVRGR